MTQRMPSVLSVIDMEQSTNRRQMQAALRLLELAIKNELTERQRSIFLMYIRDELTMQQIADTLGLTRGTVCKHIHKAIDRLRKTAQYAGFNDPKLRS